MAWHGTFHAMISSTARTNDIAGGATFPTTNCLLQIGIDVSFTTLRVLEKYNPFKIKQKRESRRNSWAINAVFDFEAY